MPFNKEIEDFAQAFSSGYSMAKSKTEQESEALDLKHKQFLVDRDPVTAAQADESHAIEMQRIRGEISDAEAARKQNELLYPLQVQQATANLAGTQTQNKIGELNLQHLPTELSQKDAQAAASLEGTQTQTAVTKAQLEHLPTEYKQQAEEFGARMEGLGLDNTAKKYAASRTPIDDAHKDALFQLDQLHAQNVISDDDYKAKRRVIDDAFTDTKNKLDLTATQQQIDASKALTAKTNAERVPLDYRNSILQAVGALNGNQPLDAPAEAVDPNLSGPRVREKPVIPALQPKTPSWGATAPGPQSAVEVPVSTIGTHDDKSEGITKGAKNSPTAKTLRKLRNGEIPSIADYLNVGTESLVDAAKSAADDAGIHNDAAVSTPGSELNFSNWLKGAHGADAETAQMAIDTVKEAPSGDSLSPQEALLATVAKGRLAFALAGMPEESLAFAKGMQGYYQQLTGQYGAFAKAAAAHGDIDATNTALMKAYMHIGNGKSLDIKPDPKKEGMFIAEIKDLKTGKIEEQHVASPDEIFGKAMGVTPGSSLEILNAAAGTKDETISDAAARVLAAEYKQYGLTAKEISDMTTSEFEKVQERLEKDITARKPKEYTLDQSKEATSQIDDALGKFKESNADQIKALKLDDPTVGTMEDLLPAASQILLYNSETGMMPQRALRATLNLVADGPSEPVMNLPDGRIMVSVAGVDPFVMSANEYAILTANRRKYGVPTASGLPPDAQRYHAGAPDAAAVPTKPAVTPVIKPNSVDSGRDWHGSPDYWKGFFQSNPNFGGTPAPSGPPPAVTVPRDYRGPG